MKILGIVEGKIASAALLIDGKIVGAAEEERYARVKNVSGFPVRAIEFCLRHAGIQVADLDKVVFSTRMDSGYTMSFIQRQSGFSVLDYVREAREYWRPILYEGRDVDIFDVFPDRVDPTVYPREFSDYWMAKYRGRVPTGASEWLEVRRKLFASYFPDLPAGKITSVRHHLSHACHAYYTSPFIGAPNTIVCTADSIGDGENAVVTRFGNGRAETLYATDSQHLGRLYRNITLLLGMKPYEHEYKVMGLAPYAPRWAAEKCYAIFDEIMQNDGVGFSYRTNPTDNYFYFREKLEGHRFDAIAAGLQDYFEDRMVRWVANCVAKFGARRVVLGGGLALNVKANQRIAQESGAECVFVAPAADDASNAIGATIAALLDLNSNRHPIHQIETVYLGDSVPEDAARSTLQDRYPGDYHQIIRDPSPSFIAEKLAAGRVVGVCKGRMEFGARALGNRSILSDARDVSVVSRINRIIKQRDFWMPFAPMVLDRHLDEYFEPVPSEKCEFMTMTFSSRPAGRAALAAGLHPSDQTGRVQVLARGNNPYLYETIEAFHELTGAGGILNTSFNLHGYPIVRTCDDAADVFDRSELDAILCGSTYVEKNRNQ